MKVTSFGEVLWDDFPSGKVLSGAPLNVLVRLRNLSGSILPSSAVEAMMPTAKSCCAKSKRKTSIPTCCKCAKNAIPALSSHPWTNAAARHTKSYIPARGDRIVVEDAALQRSR